MILKYYWWYFQKILPASLCKEIIEYALSKNKTLQATIGVTEKNKEVADQNSIKQIRDSKIIWLNDKWLFNKLIKIVQKANVEANWNFNLSYPEDIQFTIYEKGMHYGWHCDEWEEPYSDKVNDKRLIGKTRKLSLSCLLNNFEEFRGGDLEFDYRNKSITNIETIYSMQNAGDVVVFPSNLWHRVRPVTHGVRYSLVMWTCGDPYK
jgi:PKHD-type hydroxylase